MAPITGVPGPGDPGRSIAAGACRLSNQPLSPGDRGPGPGGGGSTGVSRGGPGCRGPGPGHLAPVTPGLAGDDSCEQSEQQREEPCIHTQVTPNIVPGFLKH